MKPWAIIISWNSSRTLSFSSGSTLSRRAISNVNCSISSSRRCLKISAETSEPSVTRKMAAFCRPVSWRLCPCPPGVPACLEAPPPPDGCPPPPPPPFFASAIHKPPRSHAIRIVYPIHSVHGVHSSISQVRRSAATSSGRSRAIMMAISCISRRAFSSERDFDLFLGRTQSRHTCALLEGQFSAILPTRNLITPDVGLMRKRCHRCNRVLRIRSARQFLRPRGHVPCGGQIEMLDNDLVTGRRQWHSSGVIDLRNSGNGA